MFTIWEKLGSDPGSARVFPPEYPDPLGGSSCSEGMGSISVG